MKKALKKLTPERERKLNEMRKERKNDENWYMKNREEVVRKERERERERERKR